MKSNVGCEAKLAILSNDDIKHLLEPGEVGAIIDWKVTDKNGKVLSSQCRRAESFVKVFMDLLRIQMCGYYGVDNPDVVNYSGYKQGINNDKLHFASIALANDALFGILVGTGATAPAITDYKMEILIAHGTGAGQLQYGAVTFGAVSADATTSQFTITRNFANGSGGSITVNEAGLAVKAYGYSTLHYFLTIRDATGGIAVPNGSTLTINYRLQAVI